MKKNLSPNSLDRKLLAIMRDHALAKFGDSLTNFIYSAAKSKVLEEPTGERVYDKVLAEAIHNAGLRIFMPSNSSGGDLADGAEALIGYCYLNNLFSLEELISKLESFLRDYDKEKLTDRKFERIIMTESFRKLLEEIKQRLT